MPMADAMAVPSFGACLRDARNALRPPLSQAEVAGRAGMRSPGRPPQGANVSRIECDGQTVKWPLLYRIIVGCGLDLSYFFPARLIIASVPRARSLLADQPDCYDPARVGVN